LSGRSDATGSSVCCAEKPAACAPEDLDVPACAVEAVPAARQEQDGRGALSRELDRGRPSGAAEAPVVTTTSRIRRSLSRHDPG
jgi:hypothetical protein